jgi:drug/metabolite transporter (DMT)-like permease
VKLPFSVPLAITVLSWGFNFVALKVLYVEMPPSAASLLRWAVMFALLVGIARFRGERLRPEPGDFWKIQGVGFLALGFYIVLFMEGMRGTTPAEGAIVMATSPVFTYLLSCAVRQERFDGVALIGSLIAFTGVSIVILGGAADGHGSPVSNLIVLAGSAVWALSAVAMKPLLRRYAPTALLAMAMPGALPALLPYGIAASIALDYGAISPLAWGMFASVAVVSGVVGFICFYAGMREVGPSGASLYQYLIPPTAALFAWMVLGRALAPVQWAGFVVVLCGVATAGRARARQLQLAAATA